MRFLQVLAMFFLSGLIGITAQSDACGVIVQEAITETGEVCVDLDRNEMCYGHSMITIIPRDNFQNAVPENPGDRMGISDIMRLRLMPYDEDNHIWGIALLTVQANLPDTLAGENVTMVMFGDVEFGEMDGTGGFFLQTGNEGDKCEELPNSGLLIQTPKGVGKIDLLINEVNIEMGSTVYVDARAGESMAVYLLEGSAITQVDDAQTELALGERVRFPVNDEMEVEQPPDTPDEFILDDVYLFPFDLLPRKVPLDYLGVGEFYLEPNCTGTNQQKVFLTTDFFWGLSSYGTSLNGDRPSHEEGMSLDDIYHATQFSATLNGEALRAFGEKQQVEEGGLMHFGQLFEIGYLPAGRYTFEGKSVMRSFSDSGTCSIIVIEP